IGRPASQVLGKEIAAVLPELADQGFFTLLDHVYFDGKARFGSEQVVRLDRAGNGSTEERFFNFAYQPLKSADGKIEEIFVHAVDVTEQVSARTRLEDSRKQISALANSIPQLAWMADPDGHAFWYNERCLEFTGRSADEMVALGWDHLHDPVILPLVKEQWQKA